MATRGRGGRVNPNRPPRFIINRVYEQFKPMSEWRQEDDHEKLLVYLPGFQREYIKVTIEGSNVVRVRGERLVSENKWSRFQEDYQVPESSDMKGIRAKFDGGVLTITMRRKIASAPPLPATTTTARVAETPREPKEEPKEKKEYIPQTTRLEDNTSPPQPKPTPSSTPTKQPPTEPTPQAKEAVKLRHDIVNKPSVGEETDLPKGKGKQAVLKEETKRDLEGTKGKPSEPGIVGGGLRGVLARRGMMTEDRKLLVNVGVGILIIAALGVYVSYTIGLIGKGK